MSESLRYGHVISYVTGRPWAILPEKMTEILSFLYTRATGDRIDPAIVAEYRAAAERRPKQRKADAVGVLPVYGTISYRMDLLTEMSGGTSIEGLTRDLRAMVADPDISAIVLDVDSPGGAVDGIEEFAAEVFRSRKSKPIVAVANTLAASAAYWIAASASEFVVTPTALVGSVGVIAAHENIAGMLEQKGVDVSLITAGEHKAENNPFEPLTDEGRAEIQKHVDEYYGMFTRAVARGRGVPIETVRKDFGGGRVFGAREAISLGMADRMATLDEVIATAGRSPERTNGPAALTFENEAEAALTAVRSFQARVEALTALREGRSTPVSQAHVPRLSEHRDAYRALAGAYDALIVACTGEPARQPAPLRGEAMLRLHDLDVLLAEN